MVTVNNGYPSNKTAKNKNNNTQATAFISNVNNISILPPIIDLAPQPTYFEHINTHMSKFNHKELPFAAVPLTRVDVNGKRWYQLPDGTKYPSLTTVLSHGDKPWLENWRNMLGDKKADKESERCAERGTAVHDMIEKYLKNVAEPTTGYSAKFYKLFNQLKVRLNKINNIRGLELQMFSDQLCIAGTADCIAEYDGVLSLIDFKTSNNNKTEDMIEDYFLQCTAYALMYEELFGEQINQIVVLICVEKGMMPQAFIKNKDQYIVPLLQRINTYYEQL